MASLLERLEKEGSAPLEPYGHQVGGHHLLVKYGNECICKPMDDKERGFYESFSPELRIFTPSYYGVMTVSLKRLPSGEVQITGYPRQSATSPSKQFTCSTHGSILGGENSITSKATNGASYVNPWSQEFAKIVEEMLVTQENGTNSYSTDYVVLENLTSKFSAPSVLDLKVGTRQHSDTASEEKIRKHSETCTNSTSGSLGVRMCGMQKYDAAKNEYVFRDKYYGRSLSEDGFREELRSFLHNGVRFRSELLSAIIGTLEELVDVIQRQDSYRFFSSSLLIIYDGAEESGCSLTSSHPYTPPQGLTDTRRMVDIRMIDFNNCTAPDKDSNRYPGPDRGYLLGLHSIIDTFSKML